MLGNEWRYDADERAKIDQDVDGADARGRCECLARMTEARACHHGKRHDAEGASGKRMKAGRRRHYRGSEDRETLQ